MRMKKVAIITMALALSVGGAFTSLADWQSQGNGNWRYQNEDGSWKSNTWWQDGSGKWYSFDGNGYMRKGWFQDADGKWYFLASSGEMQTGLIIIDGKTYFLNPSGDMFLGEKTVNGTTYNFGMYGTTNGQAYISNKWLGNGDKIQMPSGTGGSGSGSSSSGGTTSTYVKATTEEELNEAVESGNKDIHFETNESKTFTIAEKDVSGLTLTVDAPNASIINEAEFGKVVIKDIASSTFTEKGGSKNFEVTAPNAHIVAISGIEKLTLSGKNVKNFSINAQEAIENMVIKSAVPVTIEGDHKVNVSVDVKGVSIESSAPVAATLNEGASITLTNSEAIRNSEVTVTTNDTVTIDSSSDAGVPVVLKATKPTLAVSGAVSVTVTSKVENLKVEVEDSSAAVTIAKGSDTKDMSITVSNTTGEELDDEALKDIIKPDEGVSLPEVSVTTDKDILEKVVENIRTLVTNAKENELDGIATVSMSSDGKTITLRGKNDEMTVVDAKDEVVGLIQDFANCGATKVKIGGQEFTNSELKNSEMEPQIVLAVKNASNISGQTIVNEAKGSVDVSVFYKNEVHTIKVSISPAK